jgi:ribonuclease E
MMAARNQKRVEKAIRDAMKTDRAKYDVTRISKLGLMEISRQRIKAEKMGASYATCPVCEGYGLVKNVEPAGLAALRKLQARCLRNDFGKVSMRVPPEIAHWILNHKRDDLTGLEKRHAIRVLVEPKGSLLRHESEFEFFPREKVEVPPALVAGDRPAPPTPPDLVDMEEPQPTVAAVAAVAAAGPVEAETAASEPGAAVSADGHGLDAGGERRGRRRRRGRRGGRGRGGEANADPLRAAASADDAAAPEASFESGNGEIDSSASQEPPADDSDVPALSEDSPMAAAGDGEPGQPRRRRRRGRRGRGRGGAAAGVARNGDLPVPVPMLGAPAAIEDEPSVPRGVVAHELMPAATGGRSRRRGHRGGGGRRPGVGGEPHDPQLISPMNPVPKPRFDED